MATSPELLSSEKKIADALNSPNKAARAVLDALDPQQKNLFEIILAPEIPPNLKGTTVLGTLKQAAMTVLDTSISKFYVQSIDIPHNSLEYTRFDYLQAITDMTYADEITITFLETEASIVRTFLKHWMDLSYAKDIFHEGYTFNDNQWLARKKAIIIPKSRTGVPNTVWIEARGLRFKSIDNFMFDQQTYDPMIISVIFACDEIYLNSLI